MSTIIQSDPPIMPTPDLPAGLPDEPFSPEPSTPVPPLPDLYPTDPAQMPYPETPRMPGDPQII